MHDGDPLPPDAGPDAPRPRGCTNLKLRRLARQVGRWYDDEMRDLGLKGSQYLLLSHALALSPVAPGALALAMDLDASTLTRTLRPMVQAGWLSVEPGPDARSRRVVVTPAGTALRAAAQRRWRRAQERVNAELGAPTVVALHALLDACTARVEAARAGPRARAANDGG
ncbi:MAG: MarR family transcriptional regulator [Rubrivivax sp.]|jgi:DNA-binding MarR family transcriptional regulator|nr:MarR family transcriptional regulator [Rubrivivax sp.]